MNCDRILTLENGKIVTDTKLDQLQIKQELKDCTEEKGKDNEKDNTVQERGKLSKDEELSGDRNISW